MKDIKENTAGTVPASPATPPVVVWREAITLLRMGLAFLSPYPFLTENLKSTIERREARLGARAAHPDEAAKTRP